MNLGRSWTKIGNNVPSGRYYWRRLDSDIEGDLSTVYYEQRTSANSKWYCSMWHRLIVNFNKCKLAQGPVFFVCFFVCVCVHVHAAPRLSLV